MKKISLALFLSLMAEWAYAQTPIFDSTRVYDTVTDADTFYLFPSFKPCMEPCAWTEAPTPTAVQEYVTSDTVTVYGVAIPLRNAYGTPINDTLSLYQALLMTGEPSPIVSSYVTFRTMTVVDSVSFNRSHPRFCWFLYKDDCKTDSLVAPCYELYFDTPAKINRMVDTFYVGRHNQTEYAHNCFLQEYGGKYTGGPSCGIYQCAFGYEAPWNDRFSLCDYGSLKRWGVFFPITGFRCKPVRQYSLDSYSGTMATVSWSGGEDGGLYNVRLVGEDGSDTTYVTSGNALVLQDLSDSVRYNVMVRKQCHYATSNYDTTVYSGWLSYLSFGTTILDTVWRTVDANSANPSMGTVIGSGMYMDSSVVTLTARSLGNNEFDIWNDGDTTNPRQIFVISDTSFTAFFREKEDTVGIILPEGEDFVLNPNPAHGTVQVIVPTSALGEQLSICNLAGRELRVFDIQHQSFNINIGTLPSGVYLVKLTTPAGPITKKLLVQ